MKQYATQSTLFGFILWSFWLMPTPISAQLVLEHTYPTTDLRRINLPGSGEKWYYVDDSVRQIKLFNADHSPWKTVNYPTEINKKVSLDAMNMPVSETTFNRDSLLEFVWRFTDSLGKRIKILNENGNLVYAFNADVDSITVNQLENRPTKLFVAYGKYFVNLKTSIFSLPSMVLEKTYDNASDMRRQKFGYAGEKYYFKNRFYKKLEIYNIDHSIWGQNPINIPVRTNALNCPDPIFFASDNVFDSDTSVEYMFTYNYGLGLGLTKILNDTGTQILYASSANSFILDQKKGKSNKLIFNEIYGNGNYFRCVVYGIGSRNKKYEHTYKFPVQRILLKNNVEKYKTIDYYRDKLELFDSLHRATDTALLLPTMGFRVDNISPTICDSLVNQDTLLETIWLEYKNMYPSPSIFYNLRITKENGSDIFTIPNASSFQISQLDNRPNKLVTKMSNGFKDFETKVWRFTTTTPVNEPSRFADLDVQISPNPFTTTITINNINVEGPLSIKLFDAVGRLILSEKITTLNATLTPPNAIPSGVYFLELTDGKRRIVKRLIKIK
jgi:hypothetical protein